PSEQIGRALRKRDRPYQNPAGFPGDRTDVSESFYQCARAVCQSVRQKHFVRFARASEQRRAGNNDLRSDAWLSAIHLTPRGKTGADRSCKKELSKAFQSGPTRNLVA